ncbi:hypothetical protein OG698_19425 [Streptomyces sp. NBC_01003]|uniref:hypothetical protein n=1 Tax=Streptomyces sp. NBC_01003 TaxID=2903714 RepID=UPI0038635608|nr:hypothetical protein OG698_19425 [Streptomyces sp. NBC_01003]
MSGAGVADDGEFRVRTAGPHSPTGSHDHDTQQHPLPFDEARTNIRQGYKDAARDVATSTVGSPVTPQQISGMNDKEYEAWLDSRFGPSAEERAEAAAQQGGGAH